MNENHAEDAKSYVNRKLSFSWKNACSQDSRASFWKKQIVLWYNLVCFFFRVVAVLSFETRLRWVCGFLKVTIPLLCSAWYKQGYTGARQKVKTNIRAIIIMGFRFFQCVHVFLSDCLCVVLSLSSTPVSPVGAVPARHFSLSKTEMEIYFVVQLGMWQWVQTVQTVLLDFTIPFMQLGRIGTSSSFRVIPKCYTAKSSSFKHYLYWWRPWRNPYRPTW